MNLSIPRLRITPLARRIALAHGLELSQLVGSGPHGRIGAADVRVHLITLPPAAIVTPPPASPDEPNPSPSRPDLAPQILPPTPSPALMSPGLDPLATAMVELDLGAEDQDHINLVARLVTTAAALLPAHPWLNASWDQDGIVLRWRTHVAVGLPVPDSSPEPGRLDWRLVPDAGDLLPRGVQRALHTPAPTSAEPTFSIACLTAGASWLVAQPPLVGTAAALSLGRLQWQPVVRNERVVIGLVATLTLCYDARVLDHRQAAAFLRAIREAFASPHRT